MNKKLKLIVSMISIGTMIGSSVICYANDDNESQISLNKEATATPEVSKNQADIILEDNNTTVSGEGVEVEGDRVTITEAGTYTLTGTLSNGQIIVDAKDTDEVELKLNGVNIKCQDSASIYVKSADETILNLQKGTVNTVEDGTTYNEESMDSKVNAAIFSKDDLRIKGSGTLNVIGNYQNGIVSKDDIKVKNGIINITAINNGLKGKDSVQYEDATLTVNAGGDGIKSDNDEDADKGYISVTSGTLNITSGEDGIQAENYIDILGGNFNIISGGGNTKATKNHNNDIPPAGMMQGGFNNEEVNPSQNQGANTTNDSSEDEDISTKGIKSGKSISISDGEFSIDSADDGIHSNDSIQIDGGNFQILAGDDGIHSDSNLTINKGNLDIQKSYEGLESSNIIINDGKVNIKSSDDGINATEGSNNIDSSEDSTVDFHQGGGMTVGNALLTINGGDVYVNADGDGLDANGSIEMTGGTVLVDGPTNNGNGALDYDRTFNISGGILIAAGSSGMSQAPSITSNQNSLKITTGQKNSNTLINVQDADGNNIVTYSPSKSYSSVIISTPDIKTDSIYKVNIGGNAEGKISNGLYRGETYSDGTLLQEFKVSSVVTNVTSEGVSEGTGDGMMGGGGFHGGDRPDFPEEDMGTGTPEHRPDFPEGMGTNTPGHRPGGSEGEEQRPSDGELQGPSEGIGTGTPEGDDVGTSIAQDKDNSGNTSDNAKVITFLLGMTSLIVIKIKSTISRLKIIKK